MDSDGHNCASQEEQLSAVARMAYDDYGHLDPTRIQLLTQGFFLSREEAAALPSRIALNDDSQIHSQPQTTGSKVTTPPATAVGGQSDRGFWTEEDIKLLICLHAQRMSFQEITERFPGKSQKACQEKFYHTTKDPHDNKWKHYHDDIRREHDEKDMTEKSKTE